MGKHFKNKKKIIMENIQNEEMTKKVLEKRDPGLNADIDPETFTVREYKMKFARVTAYRLAEDSTIHCADCNTLVGRAGDYYVCLDQVQELVLEPEVFKKMFLLKVDN